MIAKREVTQQMTNILSLSPQCSALSVTIAKDRPLGSFQPFRVFHLGVLLQKAPINPVSELPVLCRYFFIP